MISTGMHSRLKLNKTDLTTALWVSFWAYILQAGNPDLLDVIIQWIAQQ